MAEAKTGLTDSMRAIEKAIAETIEHEQQTLYGLVKYLHSNETLRNFLPLEATPLNPLVLAEAPEHAGAGRQATVHVLLVSVPAPQRPERLPLPMAYVCWEWPSRRLVAMVYVDRTVPFPDAWVSPSDLLNKDFADSIEKALKEGAKIPRPSPAVEDLYKAFFEKPAVRLEQSDRVAPALIDAHSVPALNLKEAPTFVPPDMIPPPVPNDPGRLLTPPALGSAPVSDRPTAPLDDRARERSDAKRAPLPAQPKLVPAPPPSPSTPKTPEIRAVQPEIQARLTLAINSAKEERVKPVQTAPASETPEDTMDLQDFLKKLT